MAEFFVNSELRDDLYKLQPAYMIKDVQIFMKKLREKIANTQKLKFLIYECSKMRVRIFMYGSFGDCLSASRFSTEILAMGIFEYFR